MNKIRNILIIEDEQYAAERLKVLLNEIAPEFKIISVLSSIKESIDFFKHSQVDLIFMDINLSDGYSFDIFDQVDINTPIIFTTAYDEFALKAFKVNSVDYLLKPIEFERFLKAVNKINTSQNLNNDSKSLTQGTSNDWIILKSGSKSYKIKTQEILYIEGSGNYLTFHTIDKKLMILMSMNEALSILPETGFARTHKSFIVALNQIKIIENHQVQINDVKIPVATILNP